MRILEVFISKQQGYAEHHAFTLLRELKSQGHDVIYAGLKGSWLYNACRDNQIQVTEIKLYGLLALFSTMQLIRIAKRFSPDVIHTHMQQASVYGQMVANFTRLPQVVTIHNLEKVKRLPQNCHVIAASEVIRKELMKVGIDSEKLHVVHSGVELPKLIQQPELPAELNRINQLKQEKAGKLFILVAADFHHNKGHDLLLDALNELTQDIRQQFEVILYGDNNTTFGTKLKIEIDKHPMRHNIHLVNEGEIEHWLELSDALIVPSREEQLPITIIEAGLYEVGVIASRVGGIPEIVIDNNHGWLVHSDNRSELARQLKRLADKPDTLQKTASTLKKHVEEEFSVEHMVRATENILQQQIAAHR